jgi:alpha-beta hydrolase superfamily lysophospholipase
VTSPVERRLNAADGTPLQVVDWPVDHAPGKGRGVVLMHGLGEHCGRYPHVAKFFNDNGWSVRSYDHRGHGRSGGAGGDVPDNEALVRDAKVVIDDFARQFDGPPLLFGHSMGGLFAARFAIAGLSPLRALILSSPALALPLSAPQKLLLGVLRAAAPGFGVPNGLQTRYLSHDPAIETAYKSDPLVHPKISARLLSAMFSAVDFAHAHASTLKIPTLMVVAGDDRLVDASGSDAFFARLAPGIATLRRYPDFYHELLNETGAQQVFDDIRDWMGALPG